MLDKIIYALELTVVGMTSVFTVLFAFSLIIAFMKYIDSKMSANKQQKSIAHKPLTGTEIVDEVLDTELVAVITAAIQMSFSKNAQIKRIQFLGHKSQDGQWATAGRLSVMSSHNINKRN